MTQFHDTVREELTDILGTLESHYKLNSPNEVLLFADGERSLTIADLARETSSLGYQGSPDKTYQVYTHSIMGGNKKVGQLVTQPKKGLIGVEISDSGSTKTPFRFKMEVGFGGRVMDYKLEGSDGLVRAHYQKSMIVNVLKEYLR
jgi:hypothetical protein